MVVASGCPIGLIQELLDDPILPSGTVLLLPPRISEYDSLGDQETPSGRVLVRQSPAWRFFSIRHLEWLRKNLWSSENIVLVIRKSPYKDLTSAMTTLLIMLLSGKTITVLRYVLEVPGDQPDSDIEPKVKDRHENWKLVKLNPVLLVKELCNTVWSFCMVFLKDFVKYVEGEFYYYFGNYDLEGNGAPPVNLQPLDFSPESLQRDVIYARGNACIYTSLLPGGEKFLAGKRVLEIGPGINFGVSLTFACHGAEAAVTDRFLTPWDSSYHPKFYALLRDCLVDRWPAIDLSPLSNVISKEKYCQGSISVYNNSLEKLSEIPKESIDLVVSNSVFEHLYSIKSAFSELARVTKTGGFGIHMVDCRDHRDFSRPLEYLLPSNKEFFQILRESHGECGNRFRPSEMRQFFESAGFEVIKVLPDIFVDEEYLNEFLGRLRQTRRSHYRTYIPEDLRLLSCRFIVVKKPPSTGPS